MSVRVLVLVLSVDREPWRSIERDGQRATWASRSPLDTTAPIRFYRGRTRGPVRFSVAAITRLLRMMGSDSDGSFASAVRDRFLRMIGHHYCRSGATTIDDVVSAGVPETYAMVTTKLFATLTHILATENFDYLFRTNTSTYVDRQGLIEFAENLPRSGYWGGFLGVSDGITFTSGAGTLLSRDCVEAAISTEWDWALIDDVALSRVLTSQGVEAHFIGRPNIASANDAATTDLTAFMWRCKGVEERNDATTMLALHAALKSNR